MAFDWDESSPGDNDFVNQFPANERSFRTDAKGAFNVEHDPTEGRHKIGVGNDATRDAITTWVVGSLWLNTSSSPATLQRVVSIGPVVWEKIAGPDIPTGTKMSFFQASVPTGWTQDVTQNDKVLRVVSSTGGGTGGSWTISGISVNSHSLTVAQMPSHQHNLSGYPVGTLSAQSGSGLTLWNPAGASTVSTSGAGSTQGHSHNLTIGSSWRPSYIDVVIGTKD